MLGDLVSQIPQVFTPYNILLLCEAALTTLLLSAVGCLVGLVLGFGFALARMSEGWPLLPLRVLAGLYVEIVRRVPFLVTLMLFFFGAQVLGFDLSPLTIALIATSVISTAFVAEIIRGGLAAVRPSQIEAASAMNFSCPRPGP
jgi:polar amino acid transport system permease protein